MNTQASQIAASLLETDGGTFTWDGEPVTYPNGFQVGGYVPTLIDPTLDELTRWIETHRPLAEARRPLAEAIRVTQLGTWKDDQGRSHIDVTTHFYTLAVAVEVATRHKEDAIWDWSNEVSVYLVHPCYGPSVK